MFKVNYKNRKKKTKKKKNGDIWDNITRTLEAALYRQHQTYDRELGTLKSPQHRLTVNTSFTSSIALQHKQLTVLTKNFKLNETLQLTNRISTNVTMRSPSKMVNTLSGRFLEKNKHVPMAAVERNMKQQTANSN